MAEQERNIPQAVLFGAMRQTAGVIEHRTFREKRMMGANKHMTFREKRMMGANKHTTFR